MYGRIKDLLDAELSRMRGEGVYKKERAISTPQGNRVRLGDGPPVLVMCANNYLGLAQHPAVAQAAAEGLARWGYGLSSVRFIIGTQSLHTGAGEPAERVPRHRGHDPVQLLLRRQRRAVRDPAGGRGRRDLRRAQPRQHHRRRPPVQGAPAALPALRHGRARGEAEGERRRPLPPDRHRRRVLHGRRPGRPARRLRPRRSVRRAGDGR